MLLRQPATATAAPASALPVDVRLMNAIAAIVFTLALVALVAAALGWAARRPQFQFADVRLEGDLQRNSVTTVRANAMPHLAGNFFTMDLAHTRAAFEQVPWVRHAVVRRVWPNQLVVSLEEHQPVALWEGDESSDKMVNSHGEVFEANVGDVEDDSLPQFAGPDGTSAQVLDMYRRLQPMFASMDTEVTTLRLSGRGSWKVELDDGAAIELGRGTPDEVVERTTRFIRTLPQLLHKFNAPLESADLRHAEGYAVKLKGLSVNADAKQPQQASGKQ
ncbi:cell division protein FtsQ/DivIB [Scleromatobacter humisilvae]|uniref:Cell division protein FtsQ n=1 Tax=Scleromatobacter humisilvae TaxID=2897159 RepID=A0A9X1YPF5_9BURK|nr:cell division protein FtsQ/DivIB [Scleromatobacter humisilvae]MCK9688207.1 cell division protein FtsQ/DivIB [Scleromatobacter humisilvae]